MRDCRPMIKFTDPDAARKHSSNVAFNSLRRLTKSLPYDVHYLDEDRQLCVSRYCNRKRALELAEELGDRFLGITSRIDSRFVYETSE